MNKNDINQQHTIVKDGHNCELDRNRICNEVLTKYFFLPSYPKNANLFDFFLQFEQIGKSL